MECKEAIYNPLCPSCLARGVEAWLENKPHKLKSAINDEIQKILRTGKLSVSMRCVACGEKRVFLCPYCFTEFIYRRLREINANMEIMEEFMSMFNFDFEHAGYYRDAEMLGIV